MGGWVEISSRAPRGDFRAPCKIQAGFWRPARWKTQDLAQAFVQNGADCPGSASLPDLFVRAEAAGSAARAMSVAGLAKRWNEERGFGFITPQGAASGQDIFCHRTAIIDGDCLVRSQARLLLPVVAEQSHKRGREDVRT